MNTAQNLILVVDDDSAVRDSLKFALEIEGLTVQLCSGGAELLAHPALRQARCILLDDGMPVMDGVSVAERLSAAHVAAPVILMTAHATQRLRERARVAGINHVVEKPLLNGGLMDSIHAILGAQGVRITP